MKPSLALAVAALFPATGHAAWTPQPLGPAAIENVTMTGDARWLAWSARTSERYDRVAALREDGTPGRARRAPAFDHLVPHGRDGVALLTDSVRETRAGFAWTLRLRLAGRAGRIGAPRTIARIGDLGHGPLLLGGPGGAVAVIWSEGAERPRTANAYRLRAVLVDRRGRARRPRTLARVLGGVGNAGTEVGVTFGPRGQLIAVYERDERRGYGLWTREWSSRSGPGRAVRVGASAGNSRIALAAGSGGRLLVGWSSEDGGEERNLPRTYRLARRPRAGARFGVKRLDVAHQLAMDYPETLAVAIEPGGGGTFVWSGEKGAGEDTVEFPVRAVTAAADGTLGAVQTLAASGGVAGAVSTAEGVTAAWTQVAYGEDGLRYGGRINAATRAPGAATFGPAEDVSVGASRAFGATIAGGPGGAASVLYLARDRAYLSSRSG